MRSGVSPMALVASAGELAVTALGAGAVGQAEGEVVFAEVLMDAEEVVAPDEIARPASSSDKAVGAFWLGTRSFSTEDVQKTAPDEDPALKEDVEQDSVTPPVPVNAPAFVPPVALPPAQFVLPEIGLSPRAAEHDYPCVLAAEHLEPAGPGEGLALPSLPREREENAKRPIEHEPPVNTAEEPPRAHLYPSPEVAAPTPVESRSLPIVPHLPREPESPSPELQGPSAERTGREGQLAVPVRIAMDALIRPGAPTVEPVELENEPGPLTSEIPIRPHAQAWTRKQETGSGHAGGSDKERRDALDSASPPLQARHAAVENAAPTYERIVIERVASVPVRELAAPSLPVYVEVKEPASTPAPPLKRIDVRIPDPQSDIVLQVQERKGAVQVTVRTDDVQTARDIAAHLPELTRSLGQQGFHTEDLTPQSNGDRAGEHQRGRCDHDPHSGERRRQTPREDFEEYLW